MDPGAVLLALLGSANLASRARGLRAVRLDRPGEHRRRARARRRGPPDQGHDEGARRRRPTATPAVGALDPWLGAAMSVAEATRNVAITGARPLGVTNCLNYGDPTRPEAFWQLAEGVRGLADACRALGLPVTGGNVSLYNESPRRGDRADARDRRRRAARRRRDARRAGVPRRRATRSLLVGEAAPGLAGTRIRAARRRRRRGRAAGARPRTRAAPPGVRPRGDRARPRRALPGRVRRRPRGRARGVRDLGRRRARRLRLGVGDSPAVDAVRREPVAARRRGVAAPRRRRSSCSPASTACRSSALGHDRRRRGSSSSSPATARRAPPRSGAAASPTRSTCRSRTSATPGTHGLPRALGWDDGIATRPSALPDGCAACSGSSASPAEPATRPRRSPRPALFALQHRGQESAGIGGQRRRAADDLQGPRA